MSSTELHPFERAGLGRAPFRFLGMSVEVGPRRSVDPETGVTLEIGSPGQPMGSCNYCGQGIAYCYHVASADDKRFIVGCDCVMKLARTDNEKRDPVIAAIHREAKRIEREKRHARERAQLDAGRDWLESNEAALEGLPHPKIADLTMADYIHYLWQNSGTSGRLRAIARAKKVLAAPRSPGLDDDWPGDREPTDDFGRPIDHREFADGCGSYADGPDRL